MDSEPGRLWRDRILPWLVPALVVLGICCAVPGIGAAVWLYAQRCQPPAGEAALVAAYSADPMIHAAETTASAGPIDVEHYCDTTTDSGPKRYTAVSVMVTGALWRSPDELAAMYRAVAAAAGWTYLGHNVNYQMPTRDPARPTIEFSRTVNGTLSTLIIAVGTAAPADPVNPEPYELRTVVSLPPSQTTPWGTVVTGSPR